MAVPDAARPYRRILLLGADGQVGWRLRSTLSPFGEVLAATRAEGDLRSPGMVREMIRRALPDLIVNAAAYTSVDEAERQHELAMDINGHAPGVIAEEAKRLGAPLIHYSTDYVFDGRKAGCYVEEDVPNPLSAYGRSKLHGERAVAAAGGAHLVLRVAWIYGRRGRNFLLTMLRLARERDELRVVDDQTGSPTWCGAIAECTAALCAHGPLVLRERSGTYHCAADHVSWHGFAVSLLDQDPSKSEQRCRSVLPIPSSGYPSAAPRPMNSRLDSERLGRVFGIRLPPWRTQLAACFAEEGAPSLRGPPAAAPSS